MKGILALRPSPAMVVAFIALCIALAGTASAIPGHNRVKRDDIASNSVQSSDIRNKAIYSKIALAGTKFASDVNAVSLGSIWQEVGIATLYAIFYTSFALSAGLWLFHNRELGGGEG